MELRESKTLRILDEHDRRVRNIDTHLDHRCANQSLRLTAAKAFHDLLFFRRWDAAVEQFATKRVQPFAPQVVLRDRRFYVQFLAFVDQRINHINLTPTFQLRPQKRQNFAEFGLVTNGGDYFPPIARHLMDYGKTHTATP